jgi:hypothetical protein
VYRFKVIGLIAMLLAGLTGRLPAQSQDERVDLRRIPQKAVRKLIRRENLKTASDFQKILPACYQLDDTVPYRTNLKTFIVKARIGKVWEKYLTISPKRAWSSRSVHFGFLFSKSKNQFIYPEDEEGPIHEGNIVFVDLSLLGGIKNLGVAFEVTRLDEQNKTISICYIQDGVSTGTQEIRFSEIPGGETRISHITHYRSHSAFRDKELYPIFHEKLIGEFHQNILRQIEGGS